MVRKFIMKKLTLYLLFLSSFLLPAFCFAEVPKNIGGNTLKDICKIADCSESTDIYYRTHYLGKQKHKAFAIDVWDGGKAIGGSYMTWLQPNAAVAKREALKSCKREFGSTNCKVLFVNNKIADKELYELLTTKSISTSTKSISTTTSSDTTTSSETSSNLLKCTYTYYHNCFFEYIWDDGAKYSGEWQNNKFHGQGTMTWPDGTKYVGEWQNDKRTGLGKIFFPDGTTEEGVYKDDVFQYEKKSSDSEVIPPNAFASGNSWLCNSGYYKSDNSCIKVPSSVNKIPTNAHASGSSWACNAGYQKLGSTCNKIYVPKNASLSGSSWKCNSGYTKIGNSCNKVEESTDYIEELKKIKELLDSGVINDEEFKQMKQKIIDNM